MRTTHRRLTTSRAARDLRALTPGLIWNFLSQNLTQDFRPSIILQHLQCFRYRRKMLTYPLVS